MENCKFPWLTREPGEFAIFHSVKGFDNLRVRLGLGGLSVVSWNLIELPIFLAVCPLGNDLRKVIKSRLGGG